MSFCLLSINFFFFSLYFPFSLFSSPLFFCSLLRFHGYTFIPQTLWFFLSSFFCLRLWYLCLSFSHTERRKSIKRSEVRQMPALPRGGGDELAREEQVSSRRVSHSNMLTAVLALDHMTGSDHIHCWAWCDLDCPKARRVSLWAGLSHTTSLTWFSGLWVCM